MKKLSFLFAALVAGMSLSVRAEFSAWVYDYGSNTPRATQESWTAANLVDITAGASKATFSADVYNNERNCFDGNTVTRWISNVRTPWVIYNFDAATKISAYGICQSSNNGYDGRVPISWELYGSNAETPPTTVDDASWVKLDTRTSVFHNYSEVQAKYDFGSRVMCLEQPANYRSYLLKVTGNNGGDDRTVIGELEFYNISVVVPVFGDCSLDYVNDGEYALSGVFTENAPTSLSLVLTPEGDGEAKTIVLDAPEVNEPFEKTIVASVEGLSTELIYTAKLVAVNEEGSSEKEFGRYYFGPMPRPTAYAQKIEFSVSDAIATTLGESTMTDFPVLVRLSSAAVEGYDPLSFVHEGRDLYFEDENGTALSFELDTFDPAGETLVWVKIPSLSATTKFTCYYGGRENILNEPTDVWSGYLGVWHYNTTDAIAANATANANLDATATSAPTQLTGDATPFGSRAVQGGAAFQVPDYEPAYKVGNKFSVSGWFKMPSYEGVPQKWATWVSKKVGLSWDADTGWYLQMNQSKTQCGLVESGSVETLYNGLPDVTKNWIYFHYVNDGASEKVYFNGSTTPRINKSNGNIKTSTTVFQMLAANIHGDEFRLSKSTWSAARTSLEYESMKNADFLSNSGSSAMDASAPVFETPIAYVASDGSAAITFTVTDGEGDVYTLVGGVKTLVGAIGTDITLNEPKTVAITIDADACVSVGVYGVNSKGTEVTRYAESGVMNAAVVVTNTQDAKEDGRVPGIFTVSRPDTAAARDLIVNLAWSGTAEAGVDYEDNLPATVTIPAGETAVTVEVTPIINMAKGFDTTVVCTVTEGPYIAGGTATLTIKDVKLDDRFNTWIGGGADDKASTAENWSLGVPVNGQAILFDGRFANPNNKNCDWDIATDTVASWTQNNGYDGTVTLRTVYPGKSGMEVLTVTGAMTIESGTLTHPVSLNRDNQNVDFTLAGMRQDAIYRLAVSAGSFNLGENAKIDLVAKGMSQKRISSNVKVLNAAHGGSYGNQACYGNPKYPEDIGMAGNSGTDSLGKTSAGGGALKLVVSGACVIDGEISVDGEKSSGSLTASAAGSVLIEAQSVTGQGNVHADAVYCGNNSYNNGAAGRIAVITRDPVDVLTLRISASGVGSGKYAASGTVYLKDSSMTYGVLYVRNLLNAASSSQTPGRGTYVTSETGVDWTFDGIVLAGNVNLIVPEGTKLTLPNGAVSVRSTDTARYASFTPNGGLIDFGVATTQILSGLYNFAPIKSFVFPKGVNVELKNGVNLGLCGYYEQSPMPDKADRIFCTVNGDLTVDSGCAMNVYEAGTMVDSHNVWAGYGIGVHGGRKSATGLTYDSVFAPSLPAVAQSNSYGYMKAGGSLTLTVTGKFTMNGTANGSGIDSNGGGYGLAAGGAYNITAGSLVGNGSFIARGYRGGQAGGRIAIKLTDNGADFSDFSGVIQAQTAAGATESSAGSVYLQTGDEPEKGGTLVIDNISGAVTGISTPVCGTGEGSDQPADFKNVKLLVQNGGFAQLPAVVGVPFKMASLELGAVSRLDLNGCDCQVKAARINGQKLKPGTYAASDYSDYLTDSVGGGLLVVKGSGLMLLVR